MTKAETELQPVLDAVAGYFAVLADPTRLRVLRALCRGERAVGQIVEETGVSQPTVSRHLGVLHRHGIAVRRREANQVCYRIADSTTTELCRVVCRRIGDAAIRRSPLRRRLRTAFG